VDAETRQYFEALRSEIGGLHGAMTSLRGDMTSLQGDMTSLRAELQALDAKVDRVTMDLRRHFDVTAEGLREQMKILAEGVVMNAEALSRFRSEVIAEVHELRRGR
jgi:hypothetical protein